MIGVVADDVTGANDIGIMFAKAGIVTHVYAFDAFEPDAAQPAGERPGAVVLDTNSRLDSPELAYAKVREAAKRLRRAGTSLWINKTCSVFRGNIGAEFDAMLDELGEDFAVVVLGYPKNGRTTVDGVHYVRGVRLAESEFRRDPVHPMTESRLAAILGPQTARPVSLVNRAAVACGSASLRRDLERLRAETGGYAIVDVASQDELRVIADAVRDGFVLCGSSALAEELPHAAAFDPGSAPPLALPVREGVGLLCAAGSLMPQTAAQLAYAAEQGVRALAIDTRLLPEPAARAALVERLAAEAAAVMRSGRHVILHAANDEDAVAETKRIGAARGLKPAEVSRLVSGTVADIVSLVVGLTGQNRLVVAGGETSAAVCAKLGVTGMRVHREIEPGLPSCLSLAADRPLLMVLKSGSFGGPDFIIKAFGHLLDV